MTTRSIALATMILALAATAGAAERALTDVLAATGIDELKVTNRVGDVVVTAAEVPEITIDVTLVPRRGGLFSSYRAAEQEVESARLVTKADGARLELEIECDSDEPHFEAQWVVVLPAHVRLDLTNGVGEVTVRGAAGGVSLELGEGQVVKARDVTPQTAVAFPLRKTVHVRADNGKLAKGTHEITIAFESKPFGELSFTVKDTIAEVKHIRVTVPHDKENNYTPEAVAARQKFVEQFSGARISHLAHYSFDPGVTAGNIENFTGVAQIPIGFAGPIRIHGEHAQGDFLVPLATTEGTLVASYNRGMKVLNLSGG